MQSGFTFCTSPGEAVHSNPLVTLLDAALMENDSVPGYLIGEHRPSDRRVSLLVGHFTAPSRIDNSRSASQVRLEIGLVTNGVEVWVSHGLFGGQTLLCKPSA